jgi:hypothetical protein
MYNRGKLHKRSFNEMSQNNEPKNRLNQLQINSYAHKNNFKMYADNQKSNFNNLLKSVPLPYPRFSQNYYLDKQTHFNSNLKNFKVKNKNRNCYFPNSISRDLERPKDDFFQLNYFHKNQFFERNSAAFGPRASFVCDNNQLNNWIKKEHASPKKLISMYHRNHKKNYFTQKCAVEKKNDLTICKNVGFVKLKTPLKNKINNVKNKPNKILTNENTHIINSENNLQNKNSDFEKMDKLQKQKLLSLLDNFQIKSLINTLQHTHTNLKSSETIVFSISKKNNKKIKFKKKLELVGIKPKNEIIIDQFNEMIGRFTEFSLHDKVKFLQSDDLNMLRITHLFKEKKSKISKDIKFKIDSLSSVNVNEFFAQHFDFPFYLKNLVELNVKHSVLLLCILINKCIEIKLFTPTLSLDITIFNNLIKQNKLSLPLIFASFLYIISHFLVPPKFILMLKFFAFVLHRKFNFFVEESVIKTAKDNLYDLEMPTGDLPSDMATFELNLKVLFLEFLGKDDLLSKNQKTLFKKMNKKFGILKSSLQFIQTLSYV